MAEVVASPSSLQLTRKQLIRKQLRLANFEEVASEWG